MIGKRRVMMRAERDDEKAGEREERLESEEERERERGLFMYIRVRGEESEEERERQRMREGAARETVNGQRESRRRSEMKEGERKAHKRGGAQPFAASRRLAICVVFYDNYKYGRKALCLEQLVRLSKLCPYSRHRRHCLDCTEWATCT